MALSVKGHWPTTILNTKEPVIHAWTWEFISRGQRFPQKEERQTKHRDYKKVIRFSLVFTIIVISFEGTKQRYRAELR